jgi:hypothetical protein
MMADICPCLLGNTHIQYVAARNKSKTIRQWDVLTDDQHNNSVRKFITANLDQWLAMATIDPAKPDNSPPPSIAIQGMTNQDDSSHGDMPYLSSSAGSYDLLMESDMDAQYNSAPPQRVRNSVSVSGFSWAQVTAQSTQAPASHLSQVSNLTTPTQATQAQLIEMTALKTEVSNLKSQLHRFKNLIIALTKHLPPINTNYQQQPIHQNQLYHPGQPQAYQNQQPYKQATPSRQNGAAGRGHGGRHHRSQPPQDPRGRPIRTSNPQKQEVQSPPQLTRNSPTKQTPAKRSDTKSTPNRRDAQPSA